MKRAWAYIWAFAYAVLSEGALLVLYYYLIPQILDMRVLALVVTLVTILYTEVDAMPTLAWYLDKPMAAVYGRHPWFDKIIAAVGILAALGLIYMLWLVYFDWSNNLKQGITIVVLQFELMLPIFIIMGLHKRDPRYRH